MLLPVHVAVLLARLQASRRSDDPIAPLRAILQERERERWDGEMRENREVMQATWTPNIIENYSAILIIGFTFYT